MLRRWRQRRPRESGPSLFLVSILNIGPAWKRRRSLLERRALRVPGEFRKRALPKCKKTFQRRSQKKCVLPEPTALLSFVGRHCLARREKIDTGDIPWPASRQPEQEVFAKARRPRDTGARRIVR